MSPFDTELIAAIAALFTIVVGMARAYDAVRKEQIATQAASAELEKTRAEVCYAEQNELRKKTDSLLDTYQARDQEIIKAALSRIATLPNAKEA